MVVLGDRRRQAGSLAAIIRVIALATLVDAPAVVLAALAGRGLQVDLFDLVLAHVGDVEIAIGAIEREAPRVAQAISPDLRPGWRAARRGAAGERVAGRDGIGRYAADVQPQQLAQQHASILPIADGAVR